MKGAAWASLGAEFKDIDEANYLKVRPVGFLTPRATTDIQPAEQLLKDCVEANTERYKGVDVRDPNSLAHYDGERPNPLTMTMGDKVRAVSEFISGHLAHQISLQEWSQLFDLENLEMDLIYWLYVLHIHIIARRATSTPIHQWSRRREVLEELSYTMFESWTHTAETVMGRPPLSKIRNYIKDMYYVVSVNLEEALQHDGPGADLMLMAVLIKFCPLPRPEDVPMYTYYQLVHYIRFHTALFDRIPDDQFSIGNFNFLNPKDPAIFQPYTTVELDEVIRGWTVEEGESKAETTSNETKS